jgi:hypothetical protein
MEIAMSKNTETPTETQHRAPRARPRSPRRAARPSRGTHRGAIAASPQLARIEHALREAIEAAFHLAREHATSAPERACIRRVHRAFVSGPRTTALEFEDLAVTADALLRALEPQLGPLDPSVAALVVHEIARSLVTPHASGAVRMRRVPTPNRARRHQPVPSFDGERFYGLA